MQSPAVADHETVTALRGSAYGYSLNVFLFAAQQPPQGPTPTVALAPDGSNSPQAASAPSGDANVSPAQFFSSGPINVSTSGTLGPDGGVISTTDIANVNTSRLETFGEDYLNPQIEPGTDPARPATSVSSSCTASTTGLSGSTTIINGKLYLDSGKFVNNDPDYDDPDEHPPVIVTVPVNPAPNTTYEGHVHIGSGEAVDNFRYVFNEQVMNPDGSLTVNAGHQYLVGPIAKGDLIFGQSVCGVTAEPVPHTTVPSTAVPTTTTPSTTTVPTTTVPTTTVPTTTVPTTTVPTTTVPTTTAPTTSPPTTSPPTTRAPSVLQRLLNIILGLLRGLLGGLGLRLGT